MPLPTSKCDEADAATREHADKSQTDRAATDYDGGVAGAHFHFMDAAKDAGERLGQRGTLVVHGVRHFEHIFDDDAARDAHVLGVSAVVEEQIVAEVFLPAAA